MKVRKSINTETYYKKYSHLQGQINLFTELITVSYDIGKLPKEKIFQNVVAYLVENDIQVDLYDGYSEPGYFAETVICSNWNDAKAESIGDFIESYFEDVSIEWFDEWTYCVNCYKAIRTCSDGHGWQEYYLLSEDGYETCLDCVQEDIETYIGDGWYINNPEKAIPNHLLESVNDIGFHCIQEDEIFDSCKRYETGYHIGQNDTPQKALEDVYELVGKSWFLENMDYLFIINSVGQFDCQWSILVRSKNYNDN